MSEADVDIGIRVSAEKFDELIKTCFGKPKPGTSKWKTMMHAIETGKIQRGEIKLSSLKPGEMNMSNFGKHLSETILKNMKVDISIVKTGATFDGGPFINIL